MMKQFAQQARLGSKVSQLIGWFFGTLWALLGVSALPRPYDRIGCGVAIAVGLPFLARLWRHESPAGARRGLFRAPAYFLAVAAEVLAIYAASLLLPRFSAQRQVFSAVGCIVGLHFIGLWLATRSPRFLRITAGMCCVSLLSMVTPFAWHNVGLRYLLLGAGNGMVLWIAASGTD